MKHIFIIAVMIISCSLIIAIVASRRKKHLTEADDENQKIIRERLSKI